MNVKFFLFSIAVGFFIVVICNFANYIDHNPLLYVFNMIAGFTVFITTCGTYSRNNMILRKEKKDEN